MKQRSIAVLALAGMLAVGGALAAQQRPANSPQDPSDATAPLPADASTDGMIEARGERLTFTATAGTLTLPDQKGERAAAIFYCAYVLKGQSRETRPVTFVFNGGPGASSAYLHLGLLGPRIIDFGRGEPDGAAARLRDNPETWLKFTDLVMIDPIGTGWSRSVKPDDAVSFYGVREDAQVLTKAILLYLMRNGRMRSPKYLLGESYGAFRAVKIARALQQDQGVVVSGAIMVSPLIEGALQIAAHRFALGAAFQLPSLAASELERRHTFSHEAVAAAERFAMTDYLTTLAGPAPQGERAAAFYRRVAELTGLPVDVVSMSRGFVRDAYISHRRALEHKLASVFDASFVAQDAFPESDQHGDDPIVEGFTRAIGGVFVGYARDELGFKTEMTYTLFAPNIARRWDWGGSSSSASADGDLRQLLALNPSFRVLIAHGYTDLVIPYYTSRYLVDHLPSFVGSERAQLKLYRGGHMMYLIPSSRGALTADAQAFYRSASE